MNFKLPKCKKGVSPIIATLLLIVIAVAAAVVTYSFVMGFIGSSTNPSGQQGQLTYDSYSLQSDETGAYYLTVYIRNIGSKSVTLQYCYFNNVQYQVPDTNATIQPGQTNEISVTGLGQLTAGTGYNVRFVCTDGTILEFTAVAS
ncbi:MAG: archaellin/type IV pilin N-terminal domain-containing protein [Candidatus Methanosuratincola sp.]